MLQLFLLAERCLAHLYRADVPPQPQMDHVDVTVQGRLEAEVLEAVDAVEGTTATGGCRGRT